MHIKRYTPATRWGEAFAVGNGQIGGMIYGGIGTERIDLSENTFFSGNSDTDNNQKGAAKAFKNMREYALKEDFVSVHEEAQKFIGVRGNYGTNLPVGTLWIHTGISPEDVENYERNLDIETGVVTSSWDMKKNAVEGQNQKRGNRNAAALLGLLENDADEMEESVCKVQTRAFASHVHKLFCYEIKADREILNLEVKFESPRDQECGEYVRYNSDSVYFECKAREKMHSDGTTGTFLIGKANLYCDGRSKVTEEGITFLNASKLYLYLMMETDFDDIREDSTVFTEEDYFKKKLPLQCAVNRSLVRYEEVPMEKLLNEHIKDMKELYGRVTLDIEGDGYVNLIPQMFQMGRYLLYSASRDNSVLPAHLQGIWNDNVACRIGWTCDMHLDINTQMNYWPAEVTNLPETVKPLFSWIADSLAVKGRQTAKESYGLKGWAAELVSNSWGFAAPYWASPIAPCPTGGVWILTHMWEHYLTNPDRKFLQKEFYPLLKGAVEFFAGYLFEDGNGYLTCGPSISPENTFKVEGSEKGCQISNGCTYEILMIRELFDIFLQASDILRRKTKLVEKVRNDIKRLLPYRITVDGRIAEWSHSLPATDLQHRHTSHLLGVFPFAQITPENKELAEAAEVTIQAKMTPEENWEDTGWARCMLMLYEARLRHPEEAWKHICQMLDKLLEPNGFIIHPPTRGAAAFDNVYEMDGNTGLTSCIAEMLMQSHGGMIRILPCLPKEWKKGHVKGLIARGGVSVEIQWDGDICEAWLTAKKSGVYTVSYGDIKKQVELKAGKRMQVF